MLRILRLRLVMYVSTGIWIVISFKFLPPDAFIGVLTGSISLFALSPVVLVFTILTNYEHSRDLKNGWLYICMILGIFLIALAAKQENQDLAFCGIVAVLSVQEALLYRHERTQVLKKQDSSASKC